MSPSEKPTMMEKHTTTILVSVITAIVVGIGITTLQNTQATARVETKMDFMIQSFNEYKVGQKELFDPLNKRVDQLEEIVYKKKVM